MKVYKFGNDYVAQMAADQKRKEKKNVGNKVAKTPVVVGDKETIEQPVKKKVGKKKQDKEEKYEEKG